VVTATGIEGRRGLRALGPAARRASPATAGDAALDLLPDLTHAAAGRALAKRRGARSPARASCKSRRGWTACARAAARTLSADAQIPAGRPRLADALARRLKAGASRHSRPRPARGHPAPAGSPGGEVDATADAAGKLPGVFACGEMLDWEAPTGGYLLQACFATAALAAAGVRERLT
jgi:predicted flavoprotein YhiN